VLGPGITPQLSESPGSVRNAGSARPGQHNDDVYIGLLGKSVDELEKLRAEEVL
jgi:formyl-CoA transferase